MSEWLKEHAWK